MAISSCPCFPLKYTSRKILASCTLNLKMLNCIQHMRLVVSLMYDSCGTCNGADSTIRQMLVSILFGLIWSTVIFLGQALQSSNPESSNPNKIILMPWKSSNLATTILSCKIQFVWIFWLKMNLFFNDILVLSLLWFLIKVKIQISS